MADRIDWRHLMRLGLGTLRLAPDTFWAMTPGEFLAALEGAGLVPVGGQMNHGTLSALMAAFPDEIAKEQD